MMHMRGARFVAALLLLAVVAQASANVYLRSERKEESATAKLQSPERALIMRMVKNELAQTSMNSNRFKYYNKNCPEKSLASRIKTSRARLLNGQKPCLNESKYN